MRWLVMTLVFVMLLFGCNSKDDEDKYVYWTEKTESQIERLDDANINYEIKDGEIWVREKDMFKVVACCS